MTMGLSVSVVMLQIVLAKQILPIIVAVRRSHHGVDMVSANLALIEKKAWLVVKFDENNGAVDTIIEHILWAGAAHPRKEEALFMAFYFLEP